jgi:hypothetical protein
MPTKFSAREVSETVEPSKVDLTDKEKADRLKDVTEAKKDAMAEDMSSKLMPVTENTKIKEVVEEKKKAEVPTDIKVKEVVNEEPIKEVKIESKSNMPSYDDLGLNPEKDPGALLGANFDKNTKYEKLSPDELIENDIFKTRGRNIKLERNKSLRYPDPLGVVFKKENINGKEVYPSYDEKTNKWYIFQEGSDKNNWTEVTSSPIKTMLNSKYKDRNKIIESKVDYNSEEEDKKINKAKEGIVLNKYLPYVMKNYDNLSEDKKKKLKQDLSSYEWVVRKSLESNDPNLDFWLDVNDKIFNNQAISSNAISDIYTERNMYPSESKQVSKLNNDIKEGKIEILKSIAGDVFYDRKNDIFYFGDSFSRKNLKEEKAMISSGEQDSEGKNIYKEAPAEAYLKVIKKGTPVYDKIKNSLDKYNK